MEGALESHRGRALQAHGLAKLLRPFGVFPRRFPQGFNHAPVVKGYSLEGLGETFRRYLSPIAIETRLQAL